MLTLQPFMLKRLSASHVHSSSPKPT